MTDKPHQTALQTLRRSIAELGLANALWYASARFLGKLSRQRIAIHRYNLVAQPISAPPQATERSTGALEVRQVFPDDPVTEVFPRPPEVIANRFANGALCFVAFMRGEFAGFLWLAENTYDEDEVRCLFKLATPHTCVWDFDVYVEPRYRIGRSFSRLWETASQHITQSGRQWSLSRISSFNPASMASHKRLGLQTLTTATFITAGRWQLTLVGQAPFIHLSPGPGSRPTLLLTPPTSMTNPSR